jgi:O-antigen/teichoic acid export membrane protein
MSLRDILVFFSAVSLAKVLGVFTTFLVAKFLSPADYGLFITLTVINSYTPIICLGTMETMVKQYPFLLGKGAPDDARRLESTVYSSIVLSILVTGAAGGVSVLLLSLHMERMLLMAVALIIAVSAFDFFAMFTYNRSMAHQDFKLTSFLESSRSILAFVIIIPMAYGFHFKGAVIGYALSCLTIQLLSIKWGNDAFGKPSFGLVRKDLLDAVRIGLPISLIWWLLGIYQTLDRVVSMALLGSELTGIYGLGTRVINVLALIPVSAGRVLYPKISEEVGRGSDQKYLEKLVIEPARSLGMIIAPLIAITYSTLCIFPSTSAAFFRPNSFSSPSSSGVLSETASTT